LPAGTYVFKLLNSLSNRHIVQVFNEDQSHVYATILSIPNYRLQVTGKTVITFGESAVGVPQAIRAWFYPGANSGEEFVYTKTRAMELAKATNSPILAMPVEFEANITKPATSATDEPIVALKGASVIAVKPTGEEVDLGQVVTPQPEQTTTLPTAQPMPAPPPMPAQPPMPAPATATTDAGNRGERMARLPQTASSAPLLALLGLLSLGLGVALWAMPKRQV
jgi:LPXTG-motif cell wall-anchored protein